MPTTLGPEVPAIRPARGRGRTTTPHKASVSRARASSGGNTFQYSPASSLARSASSCSIKSQSGHGEVVRVEGLRHAHARLEARYYRNGDATHASWFAVVIAFFQVTDLILLFRRHKSPDFAEQLLDIVHALRIPSWPAKELSAQSIVIQKVSGSLTNAVFFVSCPSIPIIPVLLVRIYGPSSGSLISRPRELQTLHILSSRYHIGPRVYGTFENGRIEEYFHSVTLSAKDLCDPKISAWIGARMAELHQVDIAVVEAMPSSEEWNGVGIECTSAKRNIKSWLPAARDVLALPSVSDTIRRSFDLKTFEIEWNDYIRWIDEKEKQEVPSERVFAHNDTQYGNLLRSTSHKVGTPEHRQIIVVDFEYASPNPAAFDIANHFHEWTANYHSSNPHVLNPDLYPSLSQRRNFYRAYLTHLGHPIQSGIITSTPKIQTESEPLELNLQRLDDQVRIWSPATHAMWAIWGIIQAREDLERRNSEPEFDYIAYGLGRMEGFRREWRALVP